MLVEDSRRLQLLDRRFRAGGRTGRHGRNQREQLSTASDNRNKYRTPSMIPVPRRIFLFRLDRNQPVLRLPFLFRILPVGHLQEEVIIQPPPS